MSNICANTHRLKAWIDKLNTIIPNVYLDFVIDQTAIGAIHKDLIPLFTQYPDIFQINADHIALTSHLDTPDIRTTAVAKVLYEWRDAGIITGWRNELYRVATAFDDPALMAIERAAASTFGILRYGVHLNGIVAKGGYLHLWVAKRALNKPEFPGKLDHIVAGGIPAGLSVQDVVIKECYEEANIPKALAQRARPVSLISYMLDENRKRKRSLIFVYDLELPPDFVPENTDGEVASFELWPIERVIETIVNTEDFKSNNNLVLIDFMLRYGYIHPDEAHYTEIAQRLRSPVMW